MTFIRNYINYMAYKAPGWLVTLTALTFGGAIASLLFWVVAWLLPIAGAWTPVVFFVVAVLLGVGMSLYHERVGQADRDSQP